MLVRARHPRRPGSIAYGVMLSELNKFRNFVRVYVQFICHSMRFHAFTSAIPRVCRKRTVFLKRIVVMSSSELMCNICNMYTRSVCVCVCVFSIELRKLLLAIQSTFSGVAVT